MKSLVRNKKTMKNKLILLLSALSLNNAFSQNFVDNYDCTPNAYSINSVGKHVVNGNTGQALISVPLYKTTQRNLDLNLSLDYDMSGYKVNKLPGSVGHGWSLNAGGCITREMNCYCDEQVFTYLYNDYHGYFESYHFMKDFIEPKTFRLYDPEIPKKNIFKLDTFAIYEYRDFQPDIFHFSFMGKSGYFYLGNDGEWKVKCDENIDVILDVKNTVDGFACNEYFSSPIVPEFAVGGRMPYTIYKIILVDELGNKYTFGNNKDAIEYTISMNACGIVDEPIDSWTANSWYLTSVEDRFGNVLYRFSYERGAALFQIQRSYMSFPYTGNVQSPVYLTKISTLDGTDILFNNEVDDKLSPSFIYPEFYSGGKANEHLWQKFGCGYSNIVDICQKGFYYLFCNKYKWLSSSNKVLDDPLSVMELSFLKDITIKKPKDVFYVEEENVYNKIEFSYSYDNRIHLDSLNFYGRFSDKSEKYAFDYYNYKSIPKSYLHFDDVDSWGYNCYSIYYERNKEKPELAIHEAPKDDRALCHFDDLNRDKETSEDLKWKNIPKAYEKEPEKSEIAWYGHTCQPWENNYVYRLQGTEYCYDDRICYTELKPLGYNDSICSYGLLSKIHYPTGGYTAYIYESHDYSEYMNKCLREIECVDSIIKTGGVRIKSIIDCSANGDTLIRKDYVYRRAQDFENSFCLSDLSSGQLQARPIIYWLYANNNGVHNLLMKGGRPLFDLQGKFGTHITYTDVTEISTNGTCMLRRYSDLISNCGVFEKYYSYTPVASPYSTLSYNGLELGKVKEEYVYDSNRTILSYNKYYYNSGNMKYDCGFNIKCELGKMGGAYKLFHGRHDLSCVISGVRHGEHMVNDTISYVYVDSCYSVDYASKSHKQDVRFLKSVVSRRAGNKKTEKYDYFHKDGMFFFPLVSTKNFYNDNLTGKHSVVYGLMSKHWQPVFELSYTGACAKADTLLSYMEYDKSGRVLSYMDCKGVRTDVFYGKNETVDAVVHGLADRKLVMDGNVLRTDFFNMKNVNAIFYEYDNCGNIISRKSDNNMDNTYIYDNCNRLKSVLNKDKHVVKKYTYWIKNR